MGGFGSGDWTRINTKRTVEQCNSLDAGWCGRQGMFIAGNTGIVRWSNGSGEQIASVGYSVLPAETGGIVLRLEYRWDDKESIKLPILMQNTYPHLGGKRWWFTCPLVVNGTPCRRRVRKLFRSGRYFGCRHCHGLTYRSCQMAHQRERLYSRLTQLGYLDDFDWPAASFRGKPAK